MLCGLRCDRLRTWRSYKIAQQQPISVDTGRGQTGEELQLLLQSCDMGTGYPGYRAECVGVPGSGNYGNAKTDNMAPGPRREVQPTGCCAPFARPASSKHTLLRFQCLYPELE